MSEKRKVDRVVSFYKINWFKSKTKWQYLSYAVILMVSVLFGLWPGSSVPRASAGADCKDVDFIFVRGSGEVLDEASEQGKSYVAWKNSIQTEIKDLNITAKFYNLGTEAHGGYQYPAAAVSGSFQGYWNLVTAYFSAGTAAEFGESVEKGQGELIYYMLEEMQNCPNTKFVLGGYSQGAMILSKTLDRLYAPRIIYVATFGDPKIYLPEGKREGWGIFESTQACRGVNLSPYREYVPDCHAYTGILGSVQPYQPAAYAGKLGTWCNKNDIMCSSGMSLDDHTAYIGDGLYADAAKVIREKIKIAFPDKNGNIAAGNENYHNLVFLFDTTGTMLSWISLYREEAVYLAQEIINRGGDVALYTYGDIVETNGKPVLPDEKCNFGCSIDELTEIVYGIRTNGGGDIPESLLSAASFAMKMARWTTGATKSIVVLTDAGYHEVDGDGTTLEDVVEQSLAIDPVNFYVLTEKNTMPEYTKLAEMTGGGVYEIRAKDNDASLRKMTENILYRPVVKLAWMEYRGAVGEVFRFDASRSYGFGEEKLKYEWDLDGDGVFELNNAEAVVEKIYRSEWTGYVQVRVSDERGHSTMSALVKVEAQNSVHLSSVKNLQADKINNAQYELTFETDADEVMLAVNDELLGLVDFDGNMGNVILDDSFDNMKVTLIPYRDQTRGIAASVMLQETDERPVQPDWPDWSEMKAQDEINDKKNETDDENTQNPSLPKPILKQVIEMVQGNAETATASTVPKVPNTGVRRRTSVTN